MKVRYGHLKNTRENMTQMVGDIHLCCFSSIHSSSVSASYFTYH